jgi:hypothetical protein
MRSKVDGRDVGQAHAVDVAGARRTVGPAEGELEVGLGIAGTPAMVASMSRTRCGRQAETGRNHYGRGEQAARPRCNGGYFTARRVRVSVPEFPRRSRWLATVCPLR